MTSSPDPLITSLLAAVDAAPDDVPLRLHVAALLLERGRAADALQHASCALAVEPGNAEGLALLARVTAALTGAAGAGGGSSDAERQAPRGRGSDAPRTTRDDQGAAEGFDWGRAEAELVEPTIGTEAELAEPTIGTEAEFAEPAGRPGSPFAERAPVEEEGGFDADQVRVERPAVRLADVGGMEQVKQRLELAFLGPMRNPEMARAFGSTLSGGLLLYGPPGCGKTYLARAVAGELGASFSEVGLADVLDMWVGRSERNLAEIFRTARRRAPHVLFFDEVDALGQKRSHLTHAAGLRNTVNQLLAEMDSLSGRNAGVFVLGATNHPWDIDPALRRPGRFDRMLLVLPPDPPARAAILRHHLQRRPVAEVDLDRLVRATEHFSGADLAHLCDTAAEKALAESVRSGRIRPLRTADLLAACAEVQPSTRPWFATARNVALFGNADGSYDELAEYLKRNRAL